MTRRTSSRGPATARGLPWWAVLLAPVAILACSAPRPAGEEAERQRSEEAGRAFEEEHAQRKLPDLPARPTLPQVLYHAFWSNADLERAWSEWRMPFPGKLKLAGRSALEEARAAGHRFEDAKFSLQAAVTSCRSRWRSSSRSST